ncbi:hypothetical protein COBT_002061 [Conglomerata obtusa]
MIPLSMLLLHLNYTYAATVSFNTSPLENTMEYEILAITNFNPIKSCNVIAFLYILYKDYKFDECLQNKITLYSAKRENEEKNITIAFEAIIDHFIVECNFTLNKFHITNAVTLMKKLDLISALKKKSIKNKKKYPEAFYVTLIEKYLLLTNKNKDINDQELSCFKYFLDLALTLIYTFKKKRETKCIIDLLTCYYINNVREQNDIKNNYHVDFSCVTIYTIEPGKKFNNEIKKFVDKKIQSGKGLKFIICEGEIFNIDFLTKRNKVTYNSDYKQNIKCVGKLCKHASKTSSNDILKIHLTNYSHGPASKEFLIQIETLNYIIS